MLAGLAGGDALEIIVALKDLSEQGFRKVESNLTHLERQANGTNMSGFSKSAKTMEKDAEAAAGKKGGGGIGGLAGGLLGLANPATIAVAALGTVAMAGLALGETYDKIEQQEKAIAIAAKDHGIALEDMNKHVENAINTGEQYAFSAGDVRGAIAKLTEAGMSLADQQSSMPAIMDLARAKNLSLADAAKMWELALMGNTRAVKDLGIALPKVTSAQVAHDKAQKDVTTSSHALSVAQDHLSTVEASLQGKHHLTAAEALKLKIAHDHVTEASKKLKLAQEHLSKTQSDAALKADRLKQMNDAVTQAVGDQRAAVTPLQQAQTTLGNTWDRLAKAVGPGLEDLFTRLIRGLSTFFVWAMNAAGAVGNVLGPVFSRVGQVIGKFVDLIAKAIGFLQNLFGEIGKVGGAIANSPIGSLLGGGGDALRNLGNLIPHFASGGVVEPRSGGRLIVAGEAGEREYIIPESRMGTSGGGSTTVHTHIYLDGSVIADVVERHLGNRLNLRGTSTGLGSI